jgi:hypothetical protein
MELLLFLSALLSALTGAISGVRAPEVQAHQAYVAAARTAVTRAAPARIAQTYLALAGGWQSPAADILHGVHAGAALFAPIPRYLDKPRE